MAEQAFKGTLFGVSGVQRHPPIRLRGGRTYTTGWPGTFVIPRRTLFLDGSSGDVACDHYHKMERDVEEILFKALGLQAYIDVPLCGPAFYRFGIRLDPTPNAGGIIEFYN